MTDLVEAWKWHAATASGFDGVERARTRFNLARGELNLASADVVEVKRQAANWQAANSAAS